VHLLVIEQNICPVDRGEVAGSSKH